MNIQSNNKGFSLIELSIVLIILGLLVAGVTSGASLIKSARLRTIITEAEDYRSGINTYYGRYDRMPTYNLISGEALNDVQDVWKNLKSRKIVDVSANNGFVSAKYPRAFWTFAEGEGIYNNEKTLAFVGKMTDASTTKFNSILTPDDAYIVVKKMDSGKAVGSVVTVCTTDGTKISPETDQNFSTKLMDESAATTNALYVLLFNMDEGSN